MRSEHFLDGRLDASPSGRLIGLALFFEGARLLGGFRSGFGSVRLKLLTGKIGNFHFLHGDAPRSLALPYFILVFSLSFLSFCQNERPPRRSCLNVSTKLWLRLKRNIKVA
jgi:hypothetical protein